MSLQPSNCNTAHSHGPPVSPVTGTVFSRRSSWTDNRVLRHSSWKINITVLKSRSKLRNRGCCWRLDRLKSTRKIAWIRFWTSLADFESRVSAIGNTRIPRQLIKALGRNRALHQGAEEDLILSSRDAEKTSKNVGSPGQIAVPKSRMQVDQLCASCPGKELRQSVSDTTTRC